MFRQISEKVNAGEVYQMQPWINLFFKKMTIYLNVTILIYTYLFKVDCETSYPNLY